MKKIFVLILILVSIQIPKASANVLAGNAILFDGLDDFVRIPDAPHLDGMTSLTIEAWFCPLNPQGVNPIVWKSDGGDIYTDRSYELQLPNSHNQAYVSFFSGTSGWTELSKNEMQLMTNQWIHVATTYDSINGIAQLYMNGQLAVSVNSQAGGSPISEAIRNSNQDLFLGAAFGYYLEGGGTFTYGLLDEVRMWNYARSESQITQNFNRLVNPAENGLIGYWNFDESLGSQYVNDLSLYQNNGIVEGAIRVPSTVPIVPEPATLLLLGLGAVLLRRQH
jgi:hypothetical protein